jgi:hypothetical protein
MNTFSLPVAARTDPAVSGDKLINRRQILSYFPAGGYYMAGKTEIR